MCGIAGVADVAPVQDRDWLAEGCGALKHRGPDDAGEWWSEDGRVGLAHRRLSILDLTAAGHQPMSSADGKLVIVFNGEIYNWSELRRELEAKGHVFSSHTDTEVILAAYKEWGADCLARFNGMFAFALYDAEKGEVMLARDRAGEKPLFYNLTPGRLRFASELKALMADRSLPRRIDPDALDCYLSIGYIPGERCILEGYRKLPPAHAMGFDIRRGQARGWRYWQAPAAESPPNGKEVDEPALLHELDRLLEDSVRLQLAADVPVGILLSGGVDSSLITAMAVRVRSDIKTYTIGFPGHGQLDETGHAKLIARHFGTEHVEMAAQEATADLLPQLARQFDEPMCDSSMIPTFLVSQLVRQHCTVALGGDGGDELFGGYGYYSRLLWIQSRWGALPMPLRRAMARGAEILLPVGFRPRHFLQKLGEDLTTGLPLAGSVFDAASRRRLMRARGAWKTTAESILRERIPNRPDLVQRATLMDFQNYLAEDILVKVDRASMLNSLEVRAPFLDYRLIEFAFGKVPSSLKADGRDKKILPKRLAARLLPPEFDLQRKQGFAIPMAQWLKQGPFRRLFREVLLDPHGLFDRRTVRGLLAGQDRGLFNGERLFALVLFELWRREYGCGLGESPA